MPTSFVEAKNATASSTEYPWLPSKRSCTFGNFSRKRTILSISSSREIPPLTFNIKKPCSTHSEAIFKVSATGRIPIVILVGIQVL